MDNVLIWACEHADQAYWLVFALLFLAGLNIPISEDIILITAGALAGSCIDVNTPLLFICCYLAAWMSAWEVYWIGRLLGPKLYAIKWFSKMAHPEKIEKLHHYFDKYGIWTFIVGRFIPGGVRNGLFLTCGLGKMPFLRFIGRDGIAAFFSTTWLFGLGYLFAENHQAIVDFFKKYNLIAIAILAAIILGWFLWRRLKKNDGETKT